MVGTAPDDDGAVRSGAPVDGAADGVGVTTGVDVSAGVGAEPLEEEPLAPLADPQGAIVVVAHDAFSKFLIRPHSLVSILRPHRALMATQSVRYVQRYAEFFGIQLEGSLSLFD